MVIETENTAFWPWQIVAGPVMFMLPLGVGKPDTVKVCGGPVHPLTEAVTLTVAVIGKGMAGMVGMSMLPVPVGPPPGMGRLELQL